MSEKKTLYPKLKVVRVKNAFQVFAYNETYSFFDVDELTEFVKEWAKKAWEMKTEKNKEED